MKRIFHRVALTLYYLTVAAAVVITFGAVENLVR